MDAPQIQYARTPDGVNIAYAVAGDGLPVLIYSLPFTNVRMLPESARIGSVIPAIAQHMQAAWLDSRGLGMSDRDVADESFDARVTDIEAVADALHWDRFAIYAAGAGCLPIVRFVARHPQRVAKLVLTIPFAHGSDFIEQSTGPAVSGLANIDMAVMAASLMRSGGPVPQDVVDQFADLVSRSITAEQYLAILDEVGKTDISDDLAQIQCPTLVIAFEKFRNVPSALSRNVAALVPDSRLRLYDNPTADVEQYIAAVTEFLLDGEETGEASHGGSSSSPIRTILFTDLESSTALTQRLGDDKAQEILHGHDDVVRAALAEHDGEDVKHLGDGIMAAFGSAVSAVQAALQIQRDLAGGEIRVRIGLNAGEPIAEDDDYFGTTVQLAARLCDRADPGQILVSNVIRELCAGKTLTFEDAGETTLKGFDDPVRLFEVQWQDRAAPLE